jgi:flagellar biosynthesis/type III secretory pathway chaperone
MRMLRIYLIGAAIVGCAIVGVAQTSEPTVIGVPQTSEPAPAAVSTRPAIAAPVEVAKEQEEMAASIKELQELKAHNDEILKDQQAALDQLDELQKEAEQLRIFSKRG